eukprot:SAG31_NODE_27746_length_420_cov_6.009346_1_plen_48_part_01
MIHSILNKRSSREFLVATFIHMRAVVRANCDNCDSFSERLLLSVDGIQ